MSDKLCKFKLYMDCRNDSFVEHKGAEIARILRTIADTVENTVHFGSHSFGGLIQDINGNTVGQWRYLVSTDQAFSDE